MGTKIKPNFYYEPGHPSGYTDDLGIMADRNQYVPSQARGWKSRIDSSDYRDIHAWCEKHLTPGTWYTGSIYPPYIFIQKQKDVAWFMLRWG
jgi:hypothetical protein